MFLTNKSFSFPSCALESILAAQQELFQLGVQWNVATPSGLSFSSKCSFFDPFVFVILCSLQRNTANVFIPIYFLWCKLRFFFWKCVCRLEALLNLLQRRKYPPPHPFRLVLFVCHVNVSDEPTKLNIR